MSAHSSGEAGASADESDRQNVCSTRHTTIRISCSARYLPTQIDGPNENGMNAFLSVTTFMLAGALFSPRGIGDVRSASGSHRSGQKVEGRGEKAEGLW